MRVGPQPPQHCGPQAPQDETMRPSNSFSQSPFLDLAAQCTNKVRPILGIVMAERVSHKVESVGAVLKLVVAFLGAFDVPQGAAWGKIEC